jgi:hypothetical protein
MSMFLNAEACPDVTCIIVQYSSSGKPCTRLIFHDGESDVVSGILTDLSPCLRGSGKCTRLKTPFNSLSFMPPILSPADL